MSHTVSQILAAARQYPELVASETAAYMVLSLAEQSLSGPRRVCPQHVLLHPGGAITLGDVEPCSNQENDARLRSILRELLGCCAPAMVSEALSRVAAGRGDGPAVVRAELQAALVPLNRGAARRALARLYRRLTNACAEMGTEVEVDLEAERSVSRRTKRRGAAIVSEDIPIAVDETAFRVASRSAAPRLAQASSPANPETNGVNDSPAVNWYPAQTTPRQFRDRAVNPTEGTPILGSVLVRERAASDAPLRTTTMEVLPPSLQTLGGVAPQTTPALAETQRAVVEEFQSGSDEWLDTFVDAPVALVSEATEAAPTFSPRRSRVSELVQRMPSNSQGLELARKNLLDMVNESNDEPEFFGLGTVTPPPVAQDAAPEPVSPARRGPRRIVLSTLAAGVAGLSAWALLTRGVPRAPVPTIAAPRDCLVRVHVEVPKAARVFLNDAKDRAAQSGPLAQFDGVPCGGQAEVTVQVPSPQGSPLPDAWVRMPLPEVELRAAFERDAPLLVAPLGEHQ
jgi:hypothetical protein